MKEAEVELVNIFGRTLTSLNHKTTFRFLVILLKMKNFRLLFLIIEWSELLRYESRSNSWCNIIHQYQNCNKCEDGLFESHCGRYQRKSSFQIKRKFSACLIGGLDPFKCTLKRNKKDIVNLQQQDFFC